MDPNTKFTRAKIQLLIDEAFFATLICRLQHASAPVGTMCTDGRRLLWDPKLVEKESERALLTILAHEALHCALLHPLRRGDRDPQAWNIACDRAINPMLERCNLDAKAAGRTPPFEWPKSITPILDMRDEGKSAEDLYQAPMQGGGGGGNRPGQGGQQGQQGQGNPPPQGQGGQPSQQPGQQPTPQQQNGMGGVQDDPATQSGDKAELSQQEANWKQALVEAVMAGKAQGSVPASMKRLVDDLLNPVPGWRERLRRFIRDHAKDDYSWTRPNTRYAHTGFILPSLWSQRMGTLAIVRDTSGSTQDWQAPILAELKGIISECQPEKVILVDADAEVQRVLELDACDPLPEDQVGGGGTDFRPAIKRLEDYAPVCAIYLTDLEGRFPKLPPSYPILWATNAGKDTNAPFGETIHLDNQ